MKNYLIVVDMQNDFIDGSLGTKEAEAIVDKVADKIRVFDGEVVFTRDTHMPEYLETQEGRRLPVVHCVKGSFGWQIREGLEAIRPCTVIDKPTFGSSEIKAFLPETPIVVDAACCAGVTPESHKNALEAMKMCQITIENE